MRASGARLSRRPSRETSETLLAGSAKLRVPFPQVLFRKWAQNHSKFLGNLAMGSMGGVSAELRVRGRRTPECGSEAERTFPLPLSPLFSPFERGISPEKNTCSCGRVDITYSCAPLWRNRDGEAGAPALVKTTSPSPRAQKAIPAQAGIARKGGKARPSGHDERQADRPIAGQLGSKPCERSDGEPSSCLSHRTAKAASALRGTGFGPIGEACGQEKASADSRPREDRL